MRADRIAPKNSAQMGAWWAECGEFVTSLSADAERRMIKGHDRLRLRVVCRGTYNTAKSSFRKPSSPRLVASGHRPRKRAHCRLSLSSTGELQRIVTVTEILPLPSRVRLAAHRADD